MSGIKNLVQKAKTKVQIQEDTLSVSDSEMNDELLDSEEIINGKATASKLKQTVSDDPIAAQIEQLHKQRKLLQNKISSITAPASITKKIQKPPKQVEFANQQQPQQAQLTPKKTPDQVRSERIDRLKEIRASKQQQQQHQQQQTQQESSAMVEENQQKKKQENGKNASAHSAAQKPTESSSSDQKTPESDGEEEAPCEKWGAGSKIINISYPLPIPANHAVKKKKYQIQFKYLDSTSRVREATVRFGSVDGRDYIDAQNDTMRKRNTTKYGGLTNPLDGNYWRFKLCNTAPSLIQAYCDFISAQFRI